MGLDTSSQDMWPVRLCDWSHGLGSLLLLASDATERCVLRPLHMPVSSIWRFTGAFIYWVSYGGSGSGLSQNVRGVGWDGLYNPTKCYGDGKDISQRLHKCRFYDVAMGTFMKW